MMKTTFNNHIYDGLNNAVHLENANFAYDSILSSVNDIYCWNGPYRPKPILFLESVTHSSFSHEMGPKIWKSYERLEFLGDSVLQIIISHYLFKNFMQLDEGQLSKFRGSLVNEGGLHDLSRVLPINNWVLLGKGLRSDGANEALKSDIVESILGAVYLTHGFEKAQAQFIYWLDQYKKETGVSFIHLDRVKSFDPKSALQEKTMELFQVLPEYHSTQIETGEFEISLKIGELELLKKTGQNKKKIQKELAKIALEKKLYKIRGE